MLSKILERANSQCLTKYLIYGHETNSVIEKGSHEERIENSFKQFYQQLNIEFPCIDEENEIMFNLINELVTIHSEIYMELGLLAGTELCMNIFREGIISNK